MDARIKKVFKRILIYIAIGAIIGIGAFVIFMTIYDR